ncbi:MAG: YtxH domain-containing protein [Neobacillus sp.]
MTTREQETREHTQGENAESASSFLVGAIIGGIVGAAAAMLLAPKTGREIRSTLGSQAGTLKEKTVLLRENVMSKGNELVAKTTTLSQGIVQQSSELLNKKKNQSNLEKGETEEVKYIPIGGEPTKKEEPSPAEIDIRKKLEEAQKAFDEEEYKITH